MLTHDPAECKDGVAQAEAPFTLQQHNFLASVVHAVQRRQILFPEVVYLDNLLLELCQHPCGKSCTARLFALGRRLSALLKFPQEWRVVFCCLIWNRFGESLAFRCCGFCGSWHQMFSHSFFIASYSPFRSPRLCFSNRTPLPHFPTALHLPHCSHQFP